MATKHTPEPWLVLPENHPNCIYNLITNNLGIKIADCGVSYTLSQEVKKANLNRIVACVNAAAGIPTEHLPEYFKLLDDGVTVNVKLRERNAKLVAVIKDVEETIRLLLNGQVDNATTPMDRVNQSLKELKAMDENQELEIAKKELSDAAATAQEIRDNIKKKHKYYLGATDGNGDMVDFHDTPQPTSDNEYRINLEDLSAAAATAKDIRSTALKNYATVHPTKDIIYLPATNDQPFHLE